MQIVIDIPDTNITESIIRAAKWEDGSLFDMTLRSAMKDAIILPKGHGRLIDADALNTRMEQRMNEIGDDESIWETSSVATALDMFAPTIIEADVESEGTNADS